MKVRMLYLHENNDTCTRVPMPKCRFCRNLISGQTDSISVPYLWTNNVLQSNHQFRAQDKVVRIICIWESMSNILQLIFYLFLSYFPKVVICHLLPLCVSVYPSH
jgi:hypothetical protein